MLALGGASAHASLAMASTHAQSAPPPPASASGQVSTSGGAGAAAAPSADAGAPLTQAELEQLVAPIALYPDDLLSQVLMASTYPTEVVMADRWVKQNESLKGDALADALAKQGWDASVKSLVNFPQVLAMMSEKLDWTVKLGDAVLAGQKPVLDAVQALRAKAQAQGNLKSNEQQTIVVQQGPTQVIEIQSASPQVIYVPTYNPTVVYGAWPYPAYPPYYYYPPGYVAATAAISFGVGVACGLAWGYAWGGCNWRGGDINVNVNRNVNINNTRIDRTTINSGNRQWQHDASHRGGVAYRDSATAERFGGASSAQAAKARESYRGRTDGAGVQGGARQGGPGVGDRSANGARQGGPGVGDRSSGTRSPGVGDRTSGGTSRVGNSPSPSATQRPASRQSAFDGAGTSGRSAQAASQRGSASRGSMNRGSSGGVRPSGGGGRSGGGRR